MKFKRKIKLKELVYKKSHFLFGPRGVGKSFLIKEAFSGETVLIINLLKSEIYLDLSLNPENLRKMVQAGNYKAVIIDEVQKIPQLLNEVHYLIEELGLNFLLTGSSIRKLKANDANMLGGRARLASMYPLTYAEINDFHLEKYLRFGGLPAILNSDEPREDLMAYVVNYLNEEVKLESKVRKIDFFHRFLETAALYSSEVINYSNLARDTVGVSEPTIKSYYEILEDTLIGFQLFPWRKGKSRKSIASCKFYFFDTGVMHSILKSPNVLDRNSDLYGKTFEQFIAQEIRAYISYERKEASFHYWRTLDHAEVDFVINDEIAIEVKSSKKVKSDHLSGLIKIQEEGSFRALFLVTHDPSLKKIGKVNCLSWTKFLDQLWSGEIF